MTDPLSPFPKDTEGRCLSGAYKPVSHLDVEKWKAVGWEPAPRTDPFFHPFDRYAVMMRWVGNGEMVIP